MLYQETLDRMLSTLERHEGSMTRRQLVRIYSFDLPDIHEAAELRWVTITQHKPRTGRPSIVVSLNIDVNNTLPRNFPMPRHHALGIHRVSIRHELFSRRTTDLVRRRRKGGAGDRFDVTLSSATRAYMLTYPKAKPASARASASRLMKRPAVHACRQWCFASFYEIPAEPMPRDAVAIWSRLGALGNWRAEC
jgi:hypothetical protein